MSSLYTNIDGLTQAYGNVRASGREGYTKKTSTYGAHSQLVIDFDYTTLGVYDEGDPQSYTMDKFSELMAYIPAGAAIAGALIVPIEDFDAAIDVGVYEKDGTAVDDDGLVAGATPTVAGGLVTGAGAEIGEVADEDYYIVIAPAVGDPTEGRARLIVHYYK